MAVCIIFLALSASIGAIAPKKFSKLFAKQILPKKDWDSFDFDETDKDGVADTTPDGKKVLRLKDLPEIDTSKLALPGGDMYTFNPTAPYGNKPIVARNLSMGDALTINNYTSYSPNLASLLNEAQKQRSKPKINQNEPLVLILHTHGTESYAPHGKTYLPSNYGFRSTDKTQNVVAVGAVLAKVLESYGIPTIHCDIMHDEKSYNNSYAEAKKTIEDFLKRYPSIQYIFDIHRDGIETSDGKYVKPVANIDNLLTAQVMTVVGTDMAGTHHPNWEENLKLALLIQNELVSNKEGFARKINLSSSSYNEQYTKGSLLFEVGSAANTIEEAKYAAYLLGHSLAPIILGE